MPYGTLALDTISTSGNLAITGNTAVSGNITISGNVISATAFHANVRSQTANTAPVFRDTNGTEIGRLARAWVTFRGADGAIDAAFNVSSVSKTGTGAYTVNFANNFSDTLYAVVGSASTDTAVYNGYVLGPRYDLGKNAGNVSVTALSGNGNAGTAYNPLSMHVVIFR